MTLAAIPHDARDVKSSGERQLLLCAEWIGGKLKRLQPGYVRTYAFTVLVGVLFVLFLILFPLIRQMLHQ